MRGAAVPEWWNAALAWFAREDATGLGEQLAHVLTDQDVGAGGDRHRAFGVLAHGQAGRAEVRGLFLNAAGVGDDQRRMHLQREKFDVPDRVDEPDVGARRPAPEVLDPLSRARVDGEDHADLAAQDGQRAQELPERRRVIDIRRTVQRHQRVRRLEHVVGALNAAGGRQQPDERVDHDVADTEDFVVVDALADQVQVAIFRRREEEVGELVGHEAIDLFGHRAIEGAKPGFDVSDAHVQLGADERRGHRGIDVAVDEHEIRLPFQHDRFEARHDFSRLGGVRPGAHREIDVRLGNPELLEEDVRHERVVVLAGVDDRLPDAVVPQRGDDRRRLHEIGSRSDDVKNVHQLSPR